MLGESDSRAVLYTCPGREILDASMPGEGGMVGLEFSFWDVSPDALCTLDISNNIMVANAKFERTIGAMKRLSSVDIVEGIIGIEDRLRFRIALDRVRAHKQTADR